MAAAFCGLLPGPTLLEESGRSFCAPGGEVGSHHPMCPSDHGGTSCPRISSSSTIWLWAQLLLSKAAWSQSRSGGRLRCWSWQMDIQRSSKNRGGIMSWKLWYRLNQKILEPGIKSAHGYLVLSVQHAQSDRWEPLFRVGRIYSRSPVEEVSFTGIGSR